MNTSKITVAVPVHNMENKEYFLKRLLDSLWKQTFQDFDIVVSDNSEDDVLKDVCEYYGGHIDYFKNPRKGMAQNTNEAIKRSKGSMIKILYLDDFLAHSKSLEKIYHNFEGGWLVTGCEHSLHIDGVEIEGINPHRASYDGIEQNINTIGSPSVLTIENKDPIMFDENMTWLLDVDYYKRLNQKYGPPIVLKDINVIIGLGQHQITNQLSDEAKLSEQNYLNNKHE